MEGFIILLILLAIGCIVCGPVALVLSIIALNRSKPTYRERPEPAEKVKRIEKAVKPAVPPEKPEEEAKEKKPAEMVEAGVVEDEGQARRELLKMADERITERVKKAGGKEIASFEQRIGTQWVLIAGVITVIFAGGFFVKYAIDTELIGPTGRVIIAAFAGLAALAVGEITRKRGYGIVAKGVTTIGFALLYIAVFGAGPYYNLIDTTTAFVLAGLVTAAAMFYAVSLNEIVMAFLSLLGGFLTPWLVSTGENRPMALFCFVLILGVGAMLCAYYRKWRLVDVLAFLGTFALYTGWFEKFYRPTMNIANEPPKQIAIALSWLGVFFVVYLILPMLHELVNKVKAKREDVLLVLANAAVVFYYLWTILFAQYRTELAFCAVGLCVVHLAVMKTIIRQCKEDFELRLSLLIIGLFFLIIAVPLYLEMYGIAMAWAIEGVILVVIGLRYRSVWTQLGGGAALLLSFAQLLHRLPMHTGGFDLVFNPAFGTWCFVAAAYLVCHIIYRMNTELEEALRRSISEAFYAAALLLLMVTVALEWWWHCDYNIIDNAAGDRYFFKGMVIILTLFPLLLLIRPVCPGGTLSRVLAGILAGIGSIFTMVAFSEFYNDSFVIFANVNFGVALIFVGGLFAGAWLLKNTGTKGTFDTVLAASFALGGILVLWVLLTEEVYLYWYCRNRFAQKLPNWRFLSHMYISIMWAVYGAALMAIGFWRRVKLLRYISLGLFVLLLAKVFILDTSTVKNVYRIGAFFATGITLVGISYLYQFLKKKGFFETMPAEKNLNE